MKTADLRRKFLDFFKAKEHIIFPSDSLVPLDRSVLFTSAGMNQFKPYFLGQKKDLKRAASCQKCLRTDDLDKVGKTLYHHTFFEMLGNFSFGDYFKKEAISFAWEFLLDVLNLNPDSLWVSVYKDDDEAYTIWRDYIKVPTEKIVKLGPDKNFWPANAPQDGPNGPCGPCSEIFFDKGETVGCGKQTCSPACDCGRFVEIWNLVFTQFNRVAQNKLEPLPQKNIDTGMGLERMASVLQGKSSNFEIDILFPLVEYLYNILGVDKKDKDASSLVNAVVDHVRASCFAIADGVYPSNEERGYIVRKIIRRAICNLNLLGINKPILFSMVDLVSMHMKDAYPEIEEKRQAISEIIKIEEEKFLPIIEEVRDYVSKKKYIDAEELFYLYDTKGFPIEAVSMYAKKYNVTLALEGFNQLLDKRKELSRKKSMFSATIFEESSFKFNEKTLFVGYENFTAEVEILHILFEDKEISFLETLQSGLLILDKTPFYPESGGQLSDRGYIETEDGKFLVEEVYKINDTIVHKGKTIEGKIYKTKAFATIDIERRRGLARAHTATHLLQAALRKILGETVMQQGSLVDVDRLRFDFSYKSSLTNEELEKVEKLANEFILRADKVTKKILTYQEAKKEKALAFFEDKYSEFVRVVSISDYSKELCAGTHLDNTSEVGLFIILSESSISSGVRRIEALVGKQAYEYVASINFKIKELSNFLKCKPEQINSAIQKIYSELKEKDSYIVSLERQLLGYKVDEVLNSSKLIANVNFIFYEFKEKDYSLLLYLTDLIKQRKTCFFCFLVSNFEDKDIFVCRVSEDLVKKGIEASIFLEKFKHTLSLKGGGRKDLVQGIIVERKENLLNLVESCFKDFINL